MATIDERVEALATASHCWDKQFRDSARRVLQEVARDQRAACANAVLEACNHATQYKVRGETVYQAVLAAELKVKE